MQPHRPCSALLEVQSEWLLFLFLKVSFSFFLFSLLESADDHTPLVLVKC